MRLSFTSILTGQPFPAISKTLLLGKLQVIMLERENVFLLSSMCTWELNEDTVCRWHEAQDGRCQVSVCTGSDIRGYLRWILMKKHFQTVQFVLFLINKEIIYWVLIFFFFFLTIMAFHPNTTNCANRKNMLQPCSPLQACMCKQHQSKVVCLPVR